MEAAAPTVADMAMDEPMLRNNSPRYSWLRTVLVLSSNICSAHLIYNTLGLVAPLQLSYLTPHAGAINASLSAFACIVGLMTPAIGNAIDVRGNSFAVLAAGFFLEVVGSIVMLLAMSTTYSSMTLPAFVCGAGFQVAGAIVVAQSTTLAVPRLALGRPEHLGLISAINYFWGCVGVMGCGLLITHLLPLTSTSHGVYWFNLALILASSSCVLVAEWHECAFPCFTPAARPARSMLRSTLREWSGPSYKRWRLIIVARMCFFLGSAQGENLLYLLQVLSEQASKSVLLSK